MKTIIRVVFVAVLSLGAGIFIGRYATVHGILAIAAYPIVCGDEQRTHKVSGSEPGGAPAATIFIECEPFVHVRRATGI